MLILTRKIGESVIIAEDVYCTVMGFSYNGQVTLAFDAPKSMSVHRHEIQRRIWSDNHTHQRREDFLIQKETVVERLISKFQNAKALIA